MLFKIFPKTLETSPIYIKLKIKSTYLNSISRVNAQKTIMKLLEKRKRKSKTFSSIPTMDVMDGCLNHSTKNKIVRNYIKKEGISYINNKLIVVRAGAFSIKTRPVIFWPHFSKCSMLDSLPSMERFSILSYAINNVPNRDDVVIR